MSSHFSQESEDSTSDLNGPDTGSSPNAKPTKKPEQSSGDTGPTSRSTKTSAPTSRPKKPTSSAADSRARTCQSPGNAPDSQASDPDCSLRQPESLTLFSETEDGFSLKMFPDSFPQTVDEISESFSRRWPTSGFTTSLGESWTAATSECHSEGGASSSLPDVLEADVPPRFYLSPKAAAGIIRRAEKRGKALPPHLESTLRELSGASAEDSEQPTWTDGAPLSPTPSKPPQATTPEPTASTLSTQVLSRLNEDTEVTLERMRQENRERAIRAAERIRATRPMAVSENQRAEVRETPYFRQLTTGGGKPGQGHPTVRTGQSVRRLTPTECERLQGFPDGWTIP